VNTEHWNKTWKLRPSKQKINQDKVIIISIYRAPLGNFDYFLNKLEYILNYLHKYNMEFITCGDLNVNFLENNIKEAQLDMLTTFNLMRTIYFPTRIAKNSATLIGNIFIDNRKKL
jgi:exonuclease III